MGNKCSPGPKHRLCKLKEKNNHAIVINFVIIVQ